MKSVLFKFTSEEGWQPELQTEMDSEQTLVLLFGAATLSPDSQAFSDLHNAFPRSNILGCSTAGEIFGAEIYDDTLSVAVMHFDNTRLKTVYLHTDGAEHSCKIGKKIACQLDQPDLKGIFVLSDGLAVNGSELVKGINSVIPESVIVTGGLAGDGDRFEKTWVMNEWTPEPNYISAVAYYGEQIWIGHGSKGGWDSFGPRRMVTRSKANVLYELDGKPALELYKEYLGERAAGLPGTALLFPLALHSDDDKSEFTVRTVLSVSEDEQSVTFAGDIPQGYQVQLMRANFERLIDGAYDAAAMVNQDKHINGDVVNIAISCVGRRLVLGERTEEEVEAILEVLPENTRQLGFYSYGEISPYVSGECCQLHNQTMTLTTIAEYAL